MLLPLRHFLKLTDLHDFPQFYVIKIDILENKYNSHSLNAIGGQHPLKLLK